MGRGRYKKPSREENSSRSASKRELQESVVGGIILEFINADCLKHLPSIASASIDMVLCDPPYGITRNKWDSVIPLEPLWKELKRIIKRSEEHTSELQSPCNL